MEAASSRPWRVLSARRLIAALLALGLCGPAGAAGTIQRYDYKVEEATYGDIGVYSFIAEREGDRLVMTTQASLRVSALGITLYRQDVSRRERWAGNRLVEYHGVTTENGAAVTVDGRADADRFLIRTATGEIVAPAAIRPISPWSAGSTATTMFMPDTGAVTSVRVADRGETIMDVAGSPRPVRRYEIATAGDREHYQVWLDRSGVPVKFSLKDAESDATFTLQH